MCLDRFSPSWESENQGRIKTSKANYDNKRSREALREDLIKKVPEAEPWFRDRHAIRICKSDWNHPRNDLWIYMEDSRYYLMMIRKK